MNYHFTLDGAIQELKKSLREEKYEHALLLCNGVLKYDPSNKFVKKSKKKIQQFLSSKPTNHVNQLMALQKKFHNGLYDDVIHECELIINSGHNSSDIYNLYGSAFKEKGNFDRAIDAFNESIKLDGNNFVPFLNKGIIYYNSKNYNNAKKNLQASLKINPKNFFGNFAMASVLHHSIENLSIDQHLDVLNSSVEFYEKALKLDPTFLNLYSNYGNVLILIGELKKAKLIFLQGLKIEPHNSILTYNLANLYEQEKDYDNAISFFSITIKNNPKFFQAHNNLATLLLKHKKKYHLSLYHYNQAISLNRNSDYLSNKASLLEEMGDLGSAFTVISESLKINNANSKAYYNKGKILERMGEIKSAVTAYERSIEIDPDFVDAKWNNSINNLLLENFSEGWQYYEVRRRRSSWVKRAFKGKELTQLCDLNGKSILLYSEQGLGDTIQFLRFASQLVSIANKVIVEVQKPIKNILNQIPHLEIVSKDEQFTETDYHFPLMSLPRLLKITKDNITSPVDLKLNNKIIKRWQKKINKNFLNVGVAWLGSKTHEDDNHILKYRRSFSPNYFRYFEDIPNIKLMSLQKDDDLSGNEKKDIPENIHLFNNFDNHDEAFLDTIALIKNLDLVISCDTSIAHIAGSLNCPVWVPLKMVPDWRWMLKTSKTPYYPSMKLYRQEEWGNWDFVFKIMREDILNINKT